MSLCNCSGVHLQAHIHPLLLHLLVFRHAVRLQQ